MSAPHSFEAPGISPHIREKLRLYWQTSHRTYYLNNNPVLRLMISTTMNKLALMPLLFLPALTAEVRNEP